MTNNIGRAITEQRTKKGLNKAQLATLLGVSATAIGQFEKGTNNPKTEVLLKLNKIFLYDFVNDRPIEGQKTDGNSVNEPETKYNVTPVKAQLVPVYNVEFSAGVLRKLLDNQDKQFPVGYLGIPEVSGCDAIIKVKGDTMAGKINNGDWVGIKLMDKDQWFPLGHIYAIETDQVQILQYIKKGTAPKMLKISSHNPFYEEDEIHHDVIRELWSVKAILPFSKIEALI